MKLIHIHYEKEAYNINNRTSFSDNYNWITLYLESIQKKLSSSIHRIIGNYNQLCITYFRMESSFIQK